MRRAINLIRIVARRVFATVCADRRAVEIPRVVKAAAIWCNELAPAFGWARFEAEQWS